MRINHRGHREHRGKVFLVLGFKFLVKVRRGFFIELKKISLHHNSKAFSLCSLWLMPLLFLVRKEASPKQSRKAQDDFNLEKVLLF